MSSPCGAIQLVPATMPCLLRVLGRKPSPRLLNSKDEPVRAKPNSANHEPIGPLREARSRATAALRPERSSRLPRSLSHSPTIDQRTPAQKGIYDTWISHLYRRW